jgi:hypothetical protein
LLRSSNAESRNLATGLQETGWSAHWRIAARAAGGPLPGAMNVGTPSGVGFHT